MSASTVSNDTGIRPGNYRWVICALLFFSTTMNYIDRNSLSVLKTTLQNALNFSEVDYGWITFAFTASYAMFPSLIGVFVDRFGVKKSLAIALILWSIAAAAQFWASEAWTSMVRAAFRRFTMAAPPRKRGSCSRT